MPSAVILADRCQVYDLTYEGCHVFNPGSFIGAGTSFSFYTYNLAKQRSEVSIVDLDEEEE